MTVRCSFCFRPCQSEANKERHEQDCAAPRRAFAALVDALTLWQQAEKVADGPELRRARVARDAALSKVRGMRRGKL